MPRYLALFTIDKTDPKLRAWKAMTEAQQATMAEIAVPAVKAWEAAHTDVIIYAGGPLDPMKRISDAGGGDGRGQPADRLHGGTGRQPRGGGADLRGPPHMAIFPCEGVEVMPVLGDAD